MPAVRLIFVPSRSLVTSPRETPRLACSWVARFFLQPLHVMVDHRDAHITEPTSLHPALGLPQAAGVPSPVNALDLASNG